VTTVRELRHLKAVQIFDLEDIYARERVVQGPHPRPIGPVKFYVVGREVNGNAQWPHEPLELVVKHNPSGYHLFFGVVRLPNGKGRRSGLTDGTYTVRVEGRYYRPFERDVVFPRLDADAPVLFDLFPAYPYPFPGAVSGRPTLLRGSVQFLDGQGIAGVKVEVVGQEEVISTTRETGRWLLIFSDGQQAGIVTVRLTLSDGRSEDVEVPIEPGPENVLPDPVVFE
jgi:hypothetical protein